MLLYLTCRICCYILPVVYVVITSYLSYMLLNLFKTNFGLNPFLGDYPATMERQFRPRFGVLGRNNSFKPREGGGGDAHRGITLWLHLHPERSSKETRFSQRPNPVFATDNCRTTIKAELDDLLKRISLCLNRVAVDLRSIFRYCRVYENGLQKIVIR